MAKPSPQLRSDEDIKLDVVASLRWDGKVDASQVQATVRTGVVTLEGKVGSFTAKAAAEEDAWLARGVKGVENLIEVRLAGGTGPNADSEVEERANWIIQWDADLTGLDLRASVRDGVLHLEGSVDEHWKVHRCRRLVQGLQGVAGVRNSLAVVPTRNVADTALAEEISGALARNVAVNQDHVTVQVEEGRTTVSGKASSWFEMNQILDTVSSTPGVVEIEHDLEIRR